MVVVQWLPLLATLKWLNTNDSMASDTP